MYTINVTFIDSLSGTSCSDQSWEPIGYKRLREAHEEVEYTAPELAAEYGGPDSGIVALFHISDEQGAIETLAYCDRQQGERCGIRADRFLL